MVFDPSDSNQAAAVMFRRNSVAVPALESAPVTRYQPHPNVSVAQPVLAVPDRKDVGPSPREFRVNWPIRSDTDAPRFEMFNRVPRPKLIDLRNVSQWRQCSAAGPRCRYPDVVP